MPARGPAEFLAEFGHDLVQVIVRQSGQCALQHLRHLKERARRHNATGCNVGAHHRADCFVEVFVADCIAKFGGLDQVIKLAPDIAIAILSLIAKNNGGARQRVCMTKRVLDTLVRTFALVQGIANFIYPPEHAGCGQAILRADRIRLPASPSLSLRVKRR